MSFLRILLWFYTQFKTKNFFGKLNPFSESLNAIISLPVGTLMLIYTNT